MHSFVYTDEVLARHAGRFVWLSLDGDKPQNAAFMEKYPTDIWPNTMIIDSVAEKPVVRWVGSMLVAQVIQLFDDGEASIAGVAPTPADAALARADKLYAGGKFTEATQAFREALELAPDSWAKRMRAIEALLYVLRDSAQFDGCSEAARKEVPSLGDGTKSYAVCANIGLESALKGSEAIAWRKETVLVLEQAVRSALRKTKKEDLSGDDRSYLYANLVKVREALGDREGKEALAREWYDYLVEESARTPTAAGRSVYDAHRLAAALAMGEPGVVLPALEESEAAMPEDFNPPARQAVVYRELAKRATQSWSVWDKALAASDRAMAKVYGARRLQVLWDRANIHIARAKQELDRAIRLSDLRAARRLLEEAVHISDALPPGQKVLRDLDYTVSTSKLQRNLALAVQNVVQATDDEVAAMYTGIRAEGRARGEVVDPALVFQRTHRDFSTCPAGERSRTLYTDPHGVFRRYVTYSTAGSPDAPDTTSQYYYDEKGRLMSATISARVEATGALAVEKISFDGLGKQVWSNQTLQGPLTAVPWGKTGAPVIIDPKQAFDAAPPCEPSKSPVAVR